MRPNLPPVTLQEFAEHCAKAENRSDAAMILRKAKTLYAAELLSPVAGVTGPRRAAKYDLAEVCKTRILLATVGHRLETTAIAGQSDNPAVAGAFDEPGFKGFVTALENDVMCEVGQCERDGYEVANQTWFLQATSIRPFDADALEFRFEWVRADEFGQLQDADSGNVYHPGRQSLFGTIEATSVLPATALCKPIAIEIARSAGAM
ncbi:hypothetical protein DXV76_12840 [Rhodobacteraceae bacterium CCMM004]|nr:hypothetical protein DXV76_12840 [Rhodobacteraceae bacterium CCMM004]